jgi:hypothetical protein
MVAIAGDSIGAALTPRTANRRADREQAASVMRKPDTPPHSLCLVPLGCVNPRSSFSFQTENNKNDRELSSTVRPRNQSAIDS